MGRKNQELEVLETNNCLANARELLNDMTLQLLRDFLYTFAKQFGDAILEKPELSLPFKRRTGETCAYQRYR